MFGNGVGIGLDLIFPNQRLILADQQPALTEFFGVAPGPWMTMMVAGSPAEDGPILPMQITNAVLELYCPTFIDLVFRSKIKKGQAVIACPFV